MKKTPCHKARSGLGKPEREGKQGEVQLVIQPFWGWRGGGGGVLCCSSEVWVQTEDLACL